MKKRYYFMGITLIISTFMAGCKTNNTDYLMNTYQLHVAETKNPEEAMLEEEKKEIINEFMFGQTVVLPNMCEFRVIQVEKNKRIQPPNAKSFYLYYEAKTEGNVYLDFTIEVTNRRKEAVEASDFMTADYLIQDVAYQPFSVIEQDEGSNFTYGNITLVQPEETAVLHYLVEVEETQLTGLFTAKFDVGEEYYQMQYSFDTDLQQEKVQQEEVQQEKVQQEEVHEESNSQEIELQETELQETDPQDSSHSIQMGELLVSEGICEVVVNKLEYKTQLKPSNPSGNYKTYEVSKKDQVYLVLQVKVKNLSDTKIKVNEILKVKVLYKESEEYNPSTVLEKKDGSNFIAAETATIAKGNSNIIYYLFEISSQVKDSDLVIQVEQNNQLNIIQVEESLS